MTTETTHPPRTRRSWPRLALIVLVLAGAVGGGLWWWQARRIQVPVFPTDGLDPAIVVAINDARVQVVNEPRSSAAWGNYGLVLFANDRYTDCCPVFEQAEKLDPEDARWPYYRGLALVFDRPAQSVAPLRKALALNPRFGPFKLRLAEQLMQTEQLDEAEVLFRELLRSGRDGEGRALTANARAWLGIGQIHMRRGLWKEAVEPLRSAADDPSARKAAHSALTEVYLRLNKEAESQAERTKADALPIDLPWPDPLIEQAEKLRTGLDIRLSRAKIRAANGQPEEAIADIRQIVSDYPASDEAQFSLGRILLETGERAKAEVPLREALTINPRNADALYLLAQVLFDRKDYAAAEDCLQRAVSERMTFPVASFDLGQCRLMQGNKAGAERAFRDALRARPDLARAHLALGELLLETGKRDEAISFLENALKFPQTSDRAKELLDKARKK